MMAAFRAKLQSIATLASGLRVASVLGRSGLRAVDGAIIVQQPGFASAGLAGDDALVLQIDGLVLVIGGDSAERPDVPDGSALLHAGASAFVRVTRDGTIWAQGTKVVLGPDESPLPTAGVVTGQCQCAFTGAPHPIVSSVVLAAKGGA